jgi:hypothetical protein
MISAMDLETEYPINWGNTYTSNLETLCLKFRAPRQEEEEEEEINRLPWLGQSGRAAAGCACTAAVLRC